MAAKSRATKLTPRHPVDLPAWQSLATHCRRDIRPKTLAELFTRDRKRAENYTLASGDLVLDYSKNLLNGTTRKLLFKLAREAKISAAIKAMFAGEVINATENRPALHVALRAKISDRVAHERRDIADVWRVLHQLEQFVNGVHDGSLRGHTGARFTDIVNIGIGGSDLGNSMIAKALRPYWRAEMRYHPVSNIDGTQFADLKKELDPKLSLVVVCSKTFTTLETMTNANAARAWIVEALGREALTKHFAAASTNHEAMDVFGINPDHRFGFWDWVGGRYSLWSAVGLSLALVIGTENFQALLNGARRMDLHFRQAPLAENMPVLLALIAIWNNNFLGAESQAILPYDNRLERFPAFLQQLQMESNGKSVRRDGRPVKCKTGMVIWGEAGSNAQHSFYQLLHQGTRLIPADFILPVQSSGATQAQQDLAIANCLAQSEALMDGYSKKQAIADLRAAGLSAVDAKELAPHKVHAGNRPSNTILLPRLTPETLGQLIALYEHKVFVEGHIWGINSFDQWGVELGKKLASTLTDAVTDPASYEGHNEATRNLLQRIAEFRRS
ncbi:MAG TPA: glucose-6-phosphate isomerase, partial [Woeseiaceae bacterium]|nr:glucose-6-phosphate isomerase [Woeseiaceae bacterium]